MRSLQDYITFADQPMGISSGLGILAIAKYANKDGIKVLLSEIVLMSALAVTLGTLI